MNKSLFNNISLVKFILAIEAFLVILSAKGIKALIGYDGVYPNPQLLFFLSMLPILYYCKAFNFDYIKNDIILIYVILFLIFLYFLSSILSYLFTPVAFFFPLSEAIKQTLNLCIIFIPFLYLKINYLIFFLKFIVLLGFFEIIFIFYGILGVFEIISISETLKNYIYDIILMQSFTAFGFFPKWGGTFPETQQLSTFLLICYVLLDVLYNRENIGKMILKIIFIVSILYLQSKSTIPALLLYITLKNFKPTNKNILSFIMIMTIILSVIVIFIINAASHELSNTTFNLENLALEYSSFGERIFHIVKSIDIMSSNLIQLLFGIGPRAYGTVISEIYGTYFNEYTNAMSIFNVLSDIGFIGFITLILFLSLIFKKIKNYNLKLAFVVVIFAYSLQIGWGESYLILFIAALLNLDRGFRQLVIQ